MKYCCDQFLYLRVLFFALLTSLLLACGGGSGGGSNDTPVAQPPIEYPVADVGPDRSAEAGAAVLLNGSASNDPNGKALSYSWTLVTVPGGSGAALVNASTANPYFIADLSGIYVARLVVNNGEFNSPEDTVTVTVEERLVPEYPVANAGPNQNAEVGELVLLDGSGSSDPNGKAISYSWVLVTLPGGSGAALSNASSSNASFVPDLSGDYVVRLVVNNGEFNSPADTVRITVAAAPPPQNPVANAGPDQTGEIGQSVLLDGSGSSDPDGKALTYSWVLVTVPGGSGAALANASSSNASFIPDLSGDYIVRLVVNNGDLNSPADTVTITVASAPPPQFPVADAGPNQTGEIGETVLLDGSGSSDPDGKVLTFAWVLVTVPSGSGATLANASSSNASFIPDLSGDYVVRLVVNNGDLNSPADTVTITVASAPPPQNPVANAGPDQAGAIGEPVLLDGSGSSDPNGKALSYAWVLTNVPSGSVAALANASSSNASFIPDLSGNYVVRLVVNNGDLDSPADTVRISVNSVSSFSDDFAGNGSLIGYVTNNPASLPEVGRVAGRYRANLVDNSGNVTLHFNNSQGRLDAQLVSFPFEAIVRNIGIGTQANSQLAPSSAGNPFIFAGLQVHVVSLNSRNSSHVVVGHRGGTAFTIEGKNTVNGSSSVNDIGGNRVPLGRADIRIVGNSDRSLSVSWQVPNANPGVNPDNWTLYRGTGVLPGQAPSYGAQVYIGLITYAFNTSGVPFVGTCDSFEISWQP